MKSLEEVIKYKLNFLPEGAEPFYAIQTYRARRGPNPPPRFYDIYRTKNLIFSNDSYSFMEDITPLFIYISSCEKYHRENGHGKINEIWIKIIKENYKVLESGLSDTLDRPDHLGEHRISNFKEHQNIFFENEGFCRRFTKPFWILFTGGFNHFLTEEERLEEEREAREAEEAYYGYTANNLKEERLEFERQQETFHTQISYSDSDDSDDEEEELSINDFKTFKLEQCVICLEEEPKVLFCNCGHICICEKCASHRYDNCPVCKKENTILRIME